LQGDQAERSDQSGETVREGDTQEGKYHKDTAKKEDGAAKLFSEDDSGANAQLPSSVPFIKSDLRL